MRKTLFTLLSLLCCTTLAWAEGTGDGTKENPYTGVWTMSELYDKLEEGVHLALACDIRGEGDLITVKDMRLDKELAGNWVAWSPGNFMGETVDAKYYTQYAKDNSSANRKGQTFIVADKNHENTAGQDYYTIKGYFSGFYTTPDADGFVYVASAEQMCIIIRGNSNVKANPHAKIRLAQDIYLSDKADDDTFCSTFYGTLDGDGHAIKGDHYPDNTTEVRNRNYLFTYADGATFKNLTFKHIRKNSTDHSNQAIITSQAKNHCVFENITFDNVHTWTNYDNAGTAAGYATDCTFKDITVKNSDCTVDDNQAGCVVGHAKGCSFENIKVENCESTSADDNNTGGKSGGVAGRADNCTFTDVEVLGSYIKSYTEYVGGVAGYSTESRYTNCTIDDQSCVYSDGIITGSDCFLGGIVGKSEKNDKIYNCINSALIAGNGRYVGGIVGMADNSVIEGCLNTGWVICKSEVEKGVYDNYKNKTGDTRTYRGKEYVIKKYDGYDEGWNYFGGIAGVLENCNVSKCVNFGSVYASASRKLDEDAHNGGIVGYLFNGTISDCLSDFSASVKVNGICGRSWGNSSIDNCLNMTTYKDIAASNNNWDGFSGKNNYSLTTATDAHHVTKTTVEKIQSGEICALLGAAWDQNLTTDPYPTPTGSKGICYTRKLPQDFSTICLPFAIKSDEKVQYYKPQSAGYNDDKAIYYIKLAPVDQLAAGEPGFYRSLDPGTVYTFCNAGDNYQFTTQEYTVETAAGDSDFGWTMSGMLEGQDYNVFSDDTQYTNEDRQLRCSEGIARYGAYLKGPSYRDTFVNADGVPTLIYLVSSTSPYDVNFDGEVNVADVVECIEIINEQDTSYAPFIKGTESQNLDKLTKVLLGE